MIQLGTLNADGTATFTARELAWLRDVMARTQVAYQTSVVHDRATFDPGYMDHARKHLAMGVGIHVAEQAPAVAAAQLLKLTSPEPVPPYMTPMAARAMVVRGGLPKSPDGSDGWPNTA